MTQFLENKLLNLRVPGGGGGGGGGVARLQHHIVGAVLTSTQGGHCDHRLSPDYPGLSASLLREQSVRL